MVYKNHKEITLSPSSINTFYGHPYKWWLTYHCGYKTEPSIHLVKGSAVHAALENMFEERFWLGNKDYKNVLLEKAMFYFDREWTERNLRGIEWTFKTEEENVAQLQLHKEDGQFMVKSFVNILCNQIEGMLYGGKVTSAGMALKLLQPTFKEQYLKEPKLKVAGYVDAIFDNNGKITIIDYKTSNKHDDGMPEDYARQLAIYAYLYNEIKGVMPAWVGINFLRFGLMNNIQVSPSLIEYAKNTISYVRSFIDNYDEEIWYLPKPEDIREKDGAIKQANGFYFLVDHEKKLIRSPYKLKKINPKLIEAGQ